MVGGKQYNVPRAPSTDVGKDVVDKIPDEYKSTKSDTSESDEVRSEKCESSRMPRVSSKDWNMLLKSITMNASKLRKVKVRWCFSRTTREIQRRSSI